MLEKGFLLYVIQLTLLQSRECDKCNEVFSGQRFETQIRIQTQIRLSRILTLAIKCFVITKIISIYTF